MLMGFFLINFLEAIRNVERVCTGELTVKGKEQQILNETYFDIFFNIKLNYRLLYLFMC